MQRLRRVVQRTLAQQKVAALALLLALAGVIQAQAADPVFPPASRMGLTPPPGFIISKGFPGFQHVDKQATIILTELPEIAYEAIEKDVAQQMKQENVPAQPTRTEITVKDGKEERKGFILFGKPSSPQGPVLKWSMVVRYPDLTALVNVLVPEVVQDVVSDEAVRASLATLVVRTVPTEEMLSTLPFALETLSGMRVVRVQPGSAVMLTDGPKNGVEASEQPLLIISIAPLPSTPPPGERDGLARRLLGDVPGLKEAKITRSEPLRIAGQQGFETLIEAKDARSEQDLTAVQWLRFGTGTLTRVIGIARKDEWPEVFRRFREIRDGIGPR